jgi:hypothetical protein
MPFPARSCRRDGYSPSLVAAQIMPRESSKMGRTSLRDGGVNIIVQLDRPELGIVEKDHLFQSV